MRKKASNMHLLGLKTPKIFAEKQIIPKGGGGAKNDRNEQYIFLGK